MDRLKVFNLVLFLVFFHVEAQYSLDGNDSPSENAASDLQPSLGVVVGILCIMFSITFLLLIYAKFCHRGASVQGDPQNHSGLIRSRSRFSGIDKTVIESLPFFRFSSLKGSKAGLECAVCLSKFEDIEVLRLLPKCKHAFHINCVDQWLEKHSSCPLCRHKVSAEDPTIFTYSNSMRFLNQSELREDSNIELFVRREEEHRGSSRFSVGSSFRNFEKGVNKEEEVLIQEEAGDSDGDDQRVLHKFNHKIIVSDVVYKNRWSNVSSSDLMFWNTEMLGAMSSNRFSSLEANDRQFSSTSAIENEQIMKIKEEMERKRMFESKVSNINKSSPISVSGLPSTSDFEANLSHASKITNPAGRRAMSEITAVSRFGELDMKNRIRGSASLETNVKDERMRQLWLPIARRTAQWFANRERISQQPQKNTKESLNV